MTSPPVCCHANGPTAATRVAREPVCTLTGDMFNRQVISCICTTRVSLLPRPFFVEGVRGFWMLPDRSGEERWAR